jgi:hypothetical protein
MAIANAVLKDRRVHVYDAKGHQLSTIPASTGDELVGFTSSTVSVKKGRRIHVYDEKGHQLSTISA